MSTSIDAGNEDSDDSSSSSNVFPSMVVNPQKELEEFRKKWQTEIKGETSTNSKNNNNPSDENLRDLTTSVSDLSLNNLNNQDDEQVATSLFLQGAELERRGKVYEAIRLYRKSIQLVPDIEKKIYEMNKANKMAHQKYDDKKTKETGDVNDNDEPEEDQEETDDNEDLSEVDLLIRFQMYLQKSGSICKRAGSENVLITSGAHFCDLPPEIILYILRWVVSNDLDVRSLDKCSEVCKGFYVCARDPELWRAICIKVWGINVGVLDGSEYLSWRQMFYERHRILYSGCYISKTSYLRFGENSFQDQFYRPIHLIEYYRFIRFFPDESLLMYTGSDDPQQSVAKLRFKSNASTDSMIHVGHYRIHKDKVIIVLNPKQNKTSGRNRRAKIQTANNENTDRTFYIEMQIQNSSKRKFCKLEWSYYSVTHKKNKNEVTTEFELTPNMYPPFWFSRVKSYHSEANAPLK
uniref:CSON012041 protein n=1 Tax=Culicoides sonorensis TaxID=179676 RepID=A0A336M4K0_CULSO